MAIAPIIELRASVKVSIYSYYEHTSKLTCEPNKKMVTVAPHLTTILPLRATIGPIIINNKPGNQLWFYKNSKILYVLITLHPDS